MNRYLFKQENIRLLTYFSLIVLGGGGVLAYICSCYNTLKNNIKIPRELGLIR